MLDDYVCTENKPEEEQPCMLELCVRADWFTSGWTECSVTCGEGVQTREVFCGYDNANGKGVQVVEDSMCDILTKYNDTRPCTVPKEESPSQWFAGPWSECTQKCGGGEQYRRVLCFRGDKVASDCDASTMLDSMQFCNSGPCKKDPMRVPVGITGDENAVVTGELGQSLHVRCLAYGYPPPAVFWYRGHKETKLLYKDTVYEVRGNTLLIRTLAIDALGQYTCKAYNGDGKPASWLVIVRAYKPEGLFIVNEFLVPRNTSDTRPRTQPHTTAEKNTTKANTTTTSSTTTKGPRPLFTVNLSVDAIMNMANDGNIRIEKKTATATNQNVVIIQTTTQSSVTRKPIQLSTGILNFQPTTSYAAFNSQPAQSTDAIPKTNQNTAYFWTDQIKEIITDHNQGNRILILMRGVPGSGKSYLARRLVDMMIGADLNNYKTHILSTDDYFKIRGQYHYEEDKILDAHSWNQIRARNALAAGLSPVIIDNTNIEMWQMEFYLREGVKNGYIIQVVAPKTPWAKRANQLAKKNLHNVPLVTIKSMLNNYRDDVTGNILRETYGLAYPADKVPPVKRTVPPIVRYYC